MALTLQEIDEALNHAREVPEDQRGAGWHAYVDRLLAKRTVHAAIEAKQRETRLVSAPEVR